MDYNKKLDELRQITEVDAPPFLNTRIKQQIKNLQFAEAPSKWKWGAAFAFIVVLVINISMIIMSGNAAADGSKRGVENIINSLGISATNDLYNE